MALTWLAHVLNRLSDRRTRTRKRLEEVFGRKTLGSVLVGSSIFKIVEATLNQQKWLLAGWLLLSLLFTLLFLWWERLAHAADTAVEKAADAAEKAAEKQDT